MNVTINLTGDEDDVDLAALAALIDTLAGRGRTRAEPQDRVHIDIMTPAATVVSDAITVTPNVESDNAAPPALDVNGLPWDERIHAGSKALNADGSWRSRRSVSDDIVASVTAGLRAGQAAVARVEPEVDVAFPTPPAVVAAPPPPAPPVVSDGPAAPAPTAPAPPAAPAASTFNEQFQALNRRNHAAGLVYNDLHEIAQAIGLADFPALVKSQDPARLAEFIAMAEAMGKLPPLTEG